MTEAIFGLVGVVIGGLLNGGIRWLTYRRDTRREARVGARMVSSEIQENNFAVGWAKERESAEPLERIESVAWEKWRERLADGLTDSEWKTLNDYYVIVLDLARVATEGAEVEEKHLPFLGSVKQDGEKAEAAMLAYRDRHKRQRLLSYWRNLGIRLRRARANSHDEPTSIS